MSRATVVIELEGNPRSARDLAAGGVYVPKCGLRLAEECDLVVCGPNHRLMLPARVVYVDEHRGAGLELLGFSLEMKARIAELDLAETAQGDAVAEPRVEESEPDRSTLDDPEIDRRAPPDDEDNGDSMGQSATLIDLQAFDDELSIPLSPGDQADTLAGDERYGDDADDPDAGDPDADDPDADVISPATLYDTQPDDGVAAGNTDAFDTLEPELGGPGADHGDHARGSRPIPRNVHERLRGLTLPAQIKMAISGELHERIVLERLYGKNVWETLLRNPRLSAPEVSRIARYGSLPRVLLEIIIGNNAWLQVPEIRRALLSNPRLATDQIVKVLRLMPKHELRLAAIQTVYPHAVRNVARMLLRSE